MNKKAILGILIALMMFSVLIEARTASSDDEKIALSSSRNNGIVMINSMGGGMEESFGTITNVEILDEFDDIQAGRSTTMSFQFDYPALDENYNDAPLVSIVKINSLNDKFPVWKGDFSLEMKAEQFFLPSVFGELFPINTIPMGCSENPPIKFKPKDRPGIQHEINEVPNGTFYCYNANYYMLQLDSRDKVTLKLNSNPLLVPGDYEVRVGLYEMEPDFEGPKIELVSPGKDDVIAGNNIIEIKLRITDLYNIEDNSIRYKITELGIPSDGESISDELFDSGWIYDIEFNENTGLYEGEFNTTENELNESGSYWIYAEAKDVLGNEGEL